MSHWLFHILIDSHLSPSKSHHHAGGLLINTWNDCSSSLLDQQFFNDVIHYQTCGFLVCCSVQHLLLWWIFGEVIVMLPQLPINYSNCEFIISIDHHWGWTVKAITKIHASLRTSKYLFPSLNGNKLVDSNSSSRSLVHCDWLIVSSTFRSSISYIGLVKSITSCINVFFWYEKKSSWLTIQYSTFRWINIVLNK